MTLLTRVTLFAVLASVPALAEWRSIELEDEFGDPTGRTRVSATTTFDGGKHWCSMGIDPVADGKSWRDGYVVLRGRVRLVCDYFNLTGRNALGGYDVRAKIANQAPITVHLSPYESGLGGQLLSYEVDGEGFEPGHPFPRQSYGYLFSDKVFNSIRQTGSIKLSLPYYKIGRVLLTFQLEGLQEALADAGFDTRQYTQYESTTHLGSTVDKKVFWLHESDFAEYRQVHSHSQFKSTYRLR